MKTKTKQQKTPYYSITLVHNVDIGEAWVERSGKQEFSVLSTQFCCEHKSALTSEVYLKINTLFFPFRAHVHFLQKYSS